MHALLLVQIYAQIISELIKSHLQVVLAISGQELDKIFSSEFCIRFKRHKVLFKIDDDVLKFFPFQIFQVFNLCVILLVLAQRFKISFDYISFRFW